MDNFNDHNFIFIDFLKLSSDVQTAEDIISKHSEVILTPNEITGEFEVKLKAFQYFDEYHCSLLDLDEDGFLKLGKVLSEDEIITLSDSDKISTLETGISIEINQESCIFSSEDIVSFFIDDVIDEKAIVYGLFKFGHNFLLAINIHLKNDFLNY